jgi:hypothetical protein
MNRLSPLNNLSPFGGVVGSAITPQNSLLFDGTNELMQTSLANIDSSVVIGPNLMFSIICTFKVTDAENGGDIFSLYDDSSNRVFNLVGASTGDRPRFRFYTSSGVVKQVVPNNNVNSDNTWCTIVINIDTANTIGEFWVNGVDETTTNQITADTYGQGTTTNWRIGLGTVYLDGNILQLALIDRLTTPTEIANIYNSGCPNKISSVITNGDVKYLLEDNYSWNGSAIVGNNSITSVNMEESDITTQTPC